MTGRLEELEVYQLAEALCDELWNIVTQWEQFEKDTIGRQLIRAADSIAANISEAHGRYLYKENIKFCYYASGSLTETKNWIRRAAQRGCMNEEQSKQFLERIEDYGKKLQAYIRSTKNQLHRSGSNERFKNQHKQIPGDQPVSD